MEHTESYWLQTAQTQAFAQLKESIETEVLIIGGGITGITCAYCLTQSGVKPVLIEAGNLCCGTTGNTTGKVTIQHGIIYSNLRKKYGLDQAKRYAASQASALNFVKEQVKALAIDCQLTPSDSYLFAQTPEERKQIEEEYRIAQEIGIDASFIPESDFPPEHLGMVCFKNQAVFHPVRYGNALAKAAAENGAQLYCNTKATHLEDKSPITVSCENGLTVRAKHLVMATQYPFYDGPNIFYTRLFAKRAYAIAATPITEYPDGNYINVGEPTRSIRTHVENGKRVLIVVGENHPPGRGEANTSIHFDRLKQYAADLAGIDTVLAQWSAQDYDTPDQLPYIGRVSDHSNLYVASGYGKWGLTNGTLAGKLLAQLITTGNCEEEALYSRTRADFSTSMGKTITEVASSVGELIKSKLEDVQSCQGLLPGEGRVIRFDGKKAGIYRDLTDTVTILDISCTHMSTELNFNAAEKTWDCPAHGGRFGTDGRLLEGPPKRSLPVLFQGNYAELDLDH